MRILFSMTVLAAVLSSCDTTKKAMPDDSIQTLLVANHKMPCTGAAPMECMLVKSEKDSDWRYFYSSIEGFDYQSGHEYVLKVKTEKLTNVPADASSIRYILKEIVSKKETPTDHRLHDIWVFENAEGTVALNAIPKEKKPNLEIKVADKSFAGQAPCNRYFGSLDSWGSYIKFKAASTLMACPSLDAEGEYFKMLEAADEFKIEDRRLKLYGKGKWLGQFIKVD
jgi:heat shock protein HslJ